MSHYFSSNQSTLSEPFTIDISFFGKSYPFVSDAGVFSKRQFDYGSRVMLEAVIDQLSGRVLDLGCGYGPVGVLIGLHRPVALTMVDVNPRAVELAKANALAHGVAADVIVSDGLDKVSGVFDHILLNPPIRAGKAVIYRLFEQAYEHLADGAQLIIVIRKKQGADSAKRKLQAIYDRVETIDRSGGYHVIVATRSALSDRDMADHEIGQDDHKAGVDDR